MSNPLHFPQPWIRAATIFAKISCAPLEEPAGGGNWEGRWAKNYDRNEKNYDQNGDFFFLNAYSWQIAGLKSDRGNMSLSVVFFVGLCLYY